MKNLLMVTLLFIATQNIFAQLEKGIIAVGISSGISLNKNKNENTYAPGTNNLNSANSITKKTSYTIAPSAAYFISKHFAVGAQIGFTGYVTTSDNTYTYLPNSYNYNININGYSNNPYANTNYMHSKTTSAGVNIMPYIKYYIPLSEHVYFLLKGSYAATISSGKTSGYNESTNFNTNGAVVSDGKYDEYGPNKTKTFGNTIAIAPGVLFMPSKKIGLEFSLGNFISINSNTNKTTENNGNTTKATTNNIEFINLNTFSLNTGIYYFFNRK